MNLNDLTVVITSFKSEHKIFSCLNSIPKEIRVIVVENSADINFKEKIEKSFPNVECFLSGENKGYSVANNFGLSKISSKYGLILNPDTRLNKDTIETFLSTASHNPEFWLIGPAQDNRNINKIDEVKEVKDLKGFALLFNIKKFKNNFFDENFFLYFEEIDLCKKVKNEKGTIFLNNKIVVHHDGASSVNANNKEELEKNRNWHWMWSTFYFHKKYKGFLLALIIVFPKLISSMLRVIFHSINLNKKLRNIYYYRLSGLINSILGKRSWYRPRID